MTSNGADIGIGSSTPTLKTPTQIGQAFANGEDVEKDYMDLPHSGLANYSAADWSESGTKFFANNDGLRNIGMSIRSGGKTHRPRLVGYLSV